MVDHQAPGWLSTQEFEQGLMGTTTVSAQAAHLRAAVGGEGAQEWVPVLSVALQGCYHGAEQDCQAGEIRREGYRVPRSVPKHN